ncbi:hypothetical protein DL89DRAFT_266936 [Linderina pennispora]|uniref:Uncharacterized protein n=1 Tax=Linderina pennispora TaxID=61395 RepID=A0A1Y1WB96_9FUNG|nr:uncharacterized protein DL89DRAFT_266936 [Linderina pennispora]ORX70809.1 hypothetical protein DL89DRAFT_266936 [Linderina pennispora]
MPKIKFLSLSHIPSSDTNLFVLHLLSHLDSLDIVGGIDILTQMNLRFPYSKRISIFLKSIFSSFSVATLVKFEVEHYIPVSINSVGWSNLEDLAIIAFISRTTIYRLLSQLPLLKRLRVRYITPDGESCQYDKHHDILPYLPDDLNFNSMLGYLEYFDGTSRSPLVFDLDPLYEFIHKRHHARRDSMQGYPHIQYIYFSASFVEIRNQL